MQMRSQKDFASGLIFIIIGLIFSYIARTTYKMGTSSIMGPGFFPFWLGITLALLGSIVILRSLCPKKEKDRIPSVSWASITWVTGSVILFGVFLAYMGLVISLFVLVFISAMASHEFRWKGTLINALILSVIAY